MGTGVTAVGVVVFGSQLSCCRPLSISDSTEWFAGVDEVKPIRNHPPESIEFASMVYWVDHGESHSYTYCKPPSTSNLQLLASGMS